MGEILLILSPGNPTPEWHPLKTQSLQRARSSAGADGQGALINTTSSWPRTSAPWGGFQQTSGPINDSWLRPTAREGQAEGLRSSSLRLKQHTDPNVSGATLKEISFRIRNEESEAVHLVVSLMLLHFILAKLIFTHASLTKIMLWRTASLLLIINNHPKIHGVYSRGLQLGPCITSEPLIKDPVPIKSFSVCYLHRCRGALYNHAADEHSLRIPKYNKSTLESWQRGKEMATVWPPFIPSRSSPRHEG